MVREMNTKELNYIIDYQNTQKTKGLIYKQEGFECKM